MNDSSTAGHLRVAVKHRGPAPIRYTWEIFVTMKFFQWKSPATGSVRGKRRVSSETMRLRNCRRSNPGRCTTLLTKYDG
jgi:hypothetical protein